MKVKTTILIEKEEAEWIDKHAINLSKFVRMKIRELMKKSKNH